MSRTKLDNFLPFHRPFLGDEEIAEVVDTLRSGWLTMGPKTARFEEKFAELVGAKHAVAVSSCTAALHLSLEALGVGPGHEVITSPYTFPSTISAILYTGASPVLVDTLPDVPNLDPAAVAEGISERTRAILPVHIAGVPCDLDALRELARSSSATVVEDAAHALPSSYKGRRIGADGRAVAFSLYAAKNITTGEGGVLTTDDADVAEDVRVRRLHGISRDAWKRYTAEGSWYYEVTSLGFKYNMTDINAAIGIHQIDRVEGFHLRRCELARMYGDLLNAVPGIVVPAPCPWGETSWHLYIIRIDSDVVRCSRSQVIESLKEDNIGSSVHFIPAHYHPFFQRRLGYSRVDFPNASGLYESSISLPFFPSMGDDDVKAVARSLERIMRENLR
ncbi:MAG: DegT/DnrJ/EryC1/StrS family aminotransferase [Candidatus Binatia bacterium]